MEYSEEECNAKAEAAHREWAYDELCEENDRLLEENAALRGKVASLKALLIAKRPVPENFQENHGD